MLYLDVKCEIIDDVQFPNSFLDYHKSILIISIYVFSDMILYWKYKKYWDCLYREMYFIFSCSWFIYICFQYKLVVSLIWKLSVFNKKTFVFKLYVISNKSCFFRCKSWFKTEFYRKEEPRCDILFFIKISLEKKFILHSLKNM